MINKNHQKTANTSFFLIAISLVFFPIISLAATFHAIVVTDTDDLKIGKSAKVDKININQLTRNISRYTGMKLGGIDILGKQVNSRDVSAAISTLSPVSSDDVILFYYAGHGYNSSSKWPTMDFSDESFLSLRTIKEILVAKKPRLLLIFADTCNRERNDVGFYGTRSGQSRSNSHGKEENYRQLFLKTRGFIIASSSKPGTLSWSTRDGGLFTNQLLRSLEAELVSNNLPSWQNIMTSAIQPIKLPSNLPDNIQEPYFDTNIFRGMSQSDNNWQGENNNSIEEWLKQQPPQQRPVEDPWK